MKVPIKRADQLRHVFLLTQYPYPKIEKRETEEPCRKPIWVQLERIQLNGIRGMWQDMWFIFCLGTLCPLGSRNFVPQGLWDQRKMGAKTTFRGKKYFESVVPKKFWICKVLYQKRRNKKGKLLLGWFLSNPRNYFWSLIVVCSCVFRIYFEFEKVLIKRL